MISANQKHKLLRSLLSTSLPVLCKNGLGIPDVQFSIEAFVGITVGDGEEVILVSIKETITSEGSNISHVWSSPHENDTNDVKQELTTDDGANESDVCDLTEEADEEVEIGEIVDSEIFDCPRLLNASSDGSFASQSWMVKQERTEPLVKKEPRYEDSKHEEIYGEEVSREGEEGEDFQFSTPRRRQRSIPNTRFGYGPKGGRGRYIRGGRFRRFVGSRHAGHSSGFNGRGSVGDHSRSFDDTALRKGGGAVGPYQDMMKEMCEQVVSQSMSMETQYVCHICQARRCSKSSLMDHIRGTHLAMDKYTCGECGERFRWFMQLHRHRKKFHPEQGEDPGMGEADYAAEDEMGNY